MVRILSCICRKKESITIFQKLFETFRNAEMLTDVRGKKRKQMIGIIIYAMNLLV